MTKELDDIWDRQCAELDGMIEKGYLTNRDRTVLVESKRELMEYKGKSTFKEKAYIRKCIRIINRILKEDGNANKF